MDRTALSQTDRPTVDKVRRFSHTKHVYFFPQNKALGIGMVTGIESLDNGLVVAHGPFLLIFQSSQ